MGRRKVAGVERTPRVRFAVRSWRQRYQTPGERTSRLKRVASTEGRDDGCADWQKRNAA